MAEDMLKKVQDLLNHDKIMARCVLGRYQNILMDEDEFEDCREQSFLLIEWMGNLLTLAGAFLYAKFNQWRTGVSANPSDKQMPNALYLKHILDGVQGTDAYFDQASSGLRVLRVLDDLYDNFDMNFFVIKYLIINSQIEAGFNFQDVDDERRGLSLLIGFPHEESFSLSCNPDKKKFKGRGYNLAAAFNIISVYRTDPYLKTTFDTDKYKTNEIESAFMDVFCAMEFMKRVRLDVDQKGNVNFIETTTGEEKYIYSNGIVKVFETKSGECTGIYTRGIEMPKDFTTDFYLLDRIEYISDAPTTNSAIRFLYQSLSGRNSASVYFSEKEGLAPEDCDFEIPSEGSAAECFKKISGYLPGARTISSFFRGMITTHYRYHNILAQSIVDAIDEDRDAKDRILKIYVKCEETPFKETLGPVFKTLELTRGVAFPNDWKGKIDELCEYIKKDENKFCRVIDWDTLIARILIYEGPSEVFRTALLHDQTYHETKDKETVEKICDHIIAGLEMRYIDNIFDARTVSQNQIKNYGAFKSEIENLKTLFPGVHVAKIECKAIAQSYIDTIINTLTKIEKVETVKSKFAENSIQDTLEIFNTCKIENSSSNAKNAFLRTIKAFLSFYAGILKSCRSRMSYEFEKSANILSPKETEKHQLKIEEEFFAGVSERAAKLSELFSAENAVELAIKELWKFANMDPDDVRRYSAVLARAPINDAKLSKIFCLDAKENIVFNITKSESVDFEQAVEDDLLIGCLENIVKFLSGEDIDEKHKESYYDKSNYTGYKEHVKKVIYPQIVTFAKHREDSDSNDCLIMDHSGAFAKWHDGEVQILTEFKYTINNAYYAMPNLNRSEIEWWVDPLLISCYRFDDEVDK